MQPTYEKVYHHTNILREEQNYFRTENIATDNLYRCLSCRNCNDCKNSSKLEAISLKDEREQALIENSLSYDEENKTLYASLPFIQDPMEKLSCNKHIAKAIFESQMRQIKKSPELRQDILESHDKLAKKGYLLKESDLTRQDLEKMSISSHPGYFIPWKVVYKHSSQSTPVRLVYNASSKSPKNLSLNDTLAKGENVLAKIFNILVKFRSDKYALTGDITKCYNQIKLKPEFYKFQKYLWKENLDDDNPLQTRYISTVIYGIRSSGNQTIAGLQKLAKICEEKTPEHVSGAKAIENNCYMDDILVAVSTKNARDQVAKSIAATLELGSMSIKSFTFSGSKPSEDVSADSTHIGVLGYNWASEDDKILLDIKPLSFGKDKKGKLPQPVTGPIRDALQHNFTRRV